MFDAPFLIICDTVVHAIGISDTYVMIYRCWIFGGEGRKTAAPDSFLSALELTRLNNEKKKKAQLYNNDIH